MSSETDSRPVSNKLWNIRFVHLLLIEAVFQFATYLINPIISQYVIALGSSLAVGGFVAGLVASSALAVRPVTGWVADRLSKTTLLVLSALLFTVAAFGCAFTQSVGGVGLFRIVQGVAFAFRSAVVVSLVSVVVAHDHIGRAVGWVGVVTTASCAIAPSVAAALGSQIGYFGCFVIAGCLFAAGLVLAVLFKAPQDIRVRHRTMRSRKGQYRAPGFPLRDFVYVPAVPYSAMAALSGVPHGINVSLLLTVGEFRGIAGVSLYFTLYAVSALVARPLAGRLSDTRSFGVVIVPVLLVELVGCGVLIAMDSLGAVALAGMLVGIGQGSAYSALQAEAVRGADEQELGRASNTFYIGPDINMGMSPFVGGIIMQTWGVSAMYTVCFCFVLGALVLYLLMRKRSASFTSRNAAKGAAKSRP
ncbi:MFS transporter [Raoultibacter phocaeensis]|uniref:MFS transporter n=1 Tax=Raoultibacter phocaeensis TaxID=2479841 RepID=UPI00111855F9|nr:MFS transporter [Raoultibacter phocaeensis]